MDFIFNIGEHYYQGDEPAFWIDFLTTFFGSILGFGSALLIYYVETRRDNKKEAKNKLEENLNKLIYLKQLIESVLKTYNKQQLPYIKEFISQQRLNLLDLKAMRRVASNDFKRLINIDNKGVFEAWGEHFGNEPEWIKNYKRTHASLDFLEGAIFETYRIERSNNDKCYEILLEVKEYIEDIPIIISNFARQLEGELGEKRWTNEYYLFIDSHIKKFRKLIDDGANLEIINNEFLQPLLETYFSKFKTLPFPEEVLIKAKKARVKMNDVRTEVEHVLQQFEKFEAKNIEAFTYLENIIKKIEAISIK
jgi:hypothetical protein